MKIVYLADAQSNHTARWCQFFAERGHEVHLLSFSEASEIHSGVRFHSLDFSRRGKARGIEYFLKERRAVRKLLQEINPDITHAHYIAGYGHLGLLSGWHPLVLTAWGSDIYQHKRYSLTARLLTRLSLHSAEMITCDSQDLSRAVVTLSAIQDKVHVIPFGVDTSWFKPGVDNTGFMKTWLPDDSGPIVLSPRAITPVYNIDIIIRSFAQLMLEFPHARLVLKYYTVDQDYYKSLLDLINTLQIGTQVTAIGKLPYEEMAHLYNLSDVVVSLAQTDSTPVTLLEAMACERPIIASNLPGVQEWITDGQNGFLVDPRSAQQLTQKLRLILTLPEDKRQVWSNHNKAIIHERADWQVNMRRVEELYHSLIASSRKNGRK